MTDERCNNDEQYYYAFMSHGMCDANAPSIMVKDCTINGPNFGEIEKDRMKSIKALAKAIEANSAAACALARALESSAPTSIGIKIDQHMQHIDA